MTCNPLSIRQIIQLAEMTKTRWMDERDYLMQHHELQVAFYPQHLNIYHGDIEHIEPLHFRYYLHVIGERMEKGTRQFLVEFVDV